MARGAAALFAMSLGNGRPLLVVGASAGKLLPKAALDGYGQAAFRGDDAGGRRLDAHARGPGRCRAAAVAVPAAVAAWLLWRGARGIRHLPVLVRGAAVLAAAYALVLIVGAGVGGTDPLAPLPALNAHRQELTFRSIKSTADLDREVAQAQAKGSAGNARFLC